MNRAYVIKTDGTQYDLDTRPSLEEAQQIVGGYIELLPIKGTRLTLVVNEEGKLHGSANLISQYPKSIVKGLLAHVILSEMEINPIATRRFGETVGTALVGPVIVLEGWRTVG